MSITPSDQQGWKENRMDAVLVQSMGKELRHFVAEFDDCFGRREPRQHLRAYIRGQLSDLPRKSVEPIALAAKIPPRTLQWFLHQAAHHRHHGRVGQSQE